MTLMFKLRLNTLPDWLICVDFKLKIMHKGFYAFISIQSEQVYAEYHINIVATIGHYVHVLLKWGNLDNT